MTSDVYLDRLRDLVDGALSEASDRCVAVLTAALAESASPETMLVGLERFVRVMPDRAGLLRQLETSTRAVEVLFKLFAGSPYLTDILLREPTLLAQLTQPNSLGDLRGRDDFREAALASVSRDGETAALQRFQHGELLRIGICDFLGLLDLRSVTNQLSLLADALVQAALQLLSNNSGTSLERFAVLALGKLGGEELNYSSDIDLVFVNDVDSQAGVAVAQRLTRFLSDVTSHGFLYRVDLRLRPWGNAGPLVTPVATYLDYLRQQAQLWEKQALLKARVIAGDFELGEAFLKSCRPLLFQTSPDEVRESVWRAKKRIEQQLQRQGRGGGEVKLGAGTIRDVEFVVQCLQLQHGGTVPAVRSINTLDGLVRLTDFGFVRGDEFRELSSAYVFYRTIEHALQLKHCRQTHTLPSQPVELEKLARRLDFLDAEQLASHFQQHRSAVRRIFEKYVIGRIANPPEPTAESSQDRSTIRPTASAELNTARSQNSWPDELARMPEEYRRTHSAADAVQHARLLSRLSDGDPLIVNWQPCDANNGIITIIGFDQLGDLSLMCGLLFVHGFDILEGQAATEESYFEKPKGQAPAPRFVNRFVVRSRLASGDVECASAGSDAARSQTRTRTPVQQEWSAFRGELIELLKEARAGRRREAQARLARRVSDALPSARPRGPLRSPVEIDFDNDSHARTTVIQIAANDTSGFLYELTNALALLGIDIRHLEIQTVGARVQDILRVTDESGRKLLDPRRQQELRVAIVLIQHFTDLLPQSPDPEAALLHFQQLLESELQEPDWLDRLASLHRPEVLAALTKLLGVGDLFWEDFLRLQHSNLFPVLTDVAGLRQPRTRAELQADLNAELQTCRSTAERRERLNAFKDREMFRVDMRHVVGVVPEFEAFARELTELAEVVIVAACSLAESQLRTKHGSLPKQCRWCAAALGKLGGSEIGFASDIELLFIHDGDGVTSGPQVISHGEYFRRLVELFQQTLHARRAGIFRVDLRLRPYGRAGNLAVSLEEFCRYFAADGPAWPFERQSLIKLRPVGGDVEFGGEVLRRRDDLIFVSHRWDPVPVRAMRERQVRQLVRAGTFHAKFSPGALVDVEYLVQLLQLTHSDRHPSLRTPNTRQALTELTRCQILPADAAEQLRMAYLFFRRLIDALRMSRGSADDLTLPAAKSDELVGLARRLNCQPRELVENVERHAARVRAWTNSLGWPIVPT